MPFRRRPTPGSVFSATLSIQAVGIAKTNYGLLSRVESLVHGLCLQVPQYHHAELVRHEKLHYVVFIDQRIQRRCYLVSVVGIFSKPDNSPWMLELAPLIMSRTHRMTAGILICDVVPHDVVAATAQTLSMDRVDVPALCCYVKPARIDRKMHARDTVNDCYCLADKKQASYGSRLRATLCTILGSGPTIDQRKMASGLDKDISRPYGRHCMV